MTPMAVSQEHYGDYHRLPDYEDDSPPEEEEQLLVHVTEGLKGTWSLVLGHWGSAAQRRAGSLKPSCPFSLFLPRLLASHQEPG